jgi:hypothetical protein
MLFRVSLMLKDDAEAFIDTTHIDKSQNYASLAIIATWALAIALGLTFWALILPRVITPAIIYAIHLG